MNETVPYLLGVSVRPERVQSDEYPFNLPLIRSLDLAFTCPVTFFVGENGTGKSTVIEALAALCRLPVSGGSRNELAAHHGPDAASPLAPALRPAFKRRPPDGYFLRAEFQAHFASLLDARNEDPDFRPWGDPYQRYGGRSLHTRSHGEAFLAILQNRIRRGLFLFDEPESALSPQRQLVLLAHMSALVATGLAQFVVATHSPILLTYPGAQILSFDGDAVCPIALEETSHYHITRGILQNPAAYWKHLQIQEKGDAAPRTTPLHPAAARGERGKRKRGRQAPRVSRGRQTARRTVSREVAIELEEPGAGAIATRGKTVVVRLRGTLHRGDVFMDAELYTFTIGGRVAIAGLEYGVEGMREGGRRRIRVPPHLAYRDVGVAGKIPPNALLFFDVELVEVRD